MASNVGAGNVDVDAGDGSELAQIMELAILRLSGVLLMGERVLITIGRWHREGVLGGSMMVLAVVVVAAYTSAAAIGSTALETLPQVATTACTLPSTSPSTPASATATTATTATSTPGGLDSELGMVTRLIRRGGGV